MRLIDAEAFKKLLVDRQITDQFFNVRERNEIGCIIDMLDKVPTIEFVRCKDCRYYETVEDIILPNVVRGCCGYDPHNRATGEEEFCSRGEWKKEKQIKIWAEKNSEKAAKLAKKSKVEND